MRDEGNAAGYMVTAFILGEVTGAAVALLLAPSSGEEMRRNIADRAREGRDRAADAARQGKEFINRQRDTIANAVERGREAYQQARTGGTTGVQPAAGPAGPGTGGAGDAL